VTSAFNSPGIVLDASAIVALPGSAYAQSLVRVFAKMNRPIIVPALSLAAACLTGRVRAAAFDDPAFTVTAVSQPMVPDLVDLVLTSVIPLTLDSAQAAHHAVTGGSVLVTAAGDRYRGLASPVWLDELS